MDAAVISAKYWRRSRTLIFNAMVAALAALADVTGLLQPVASPRVYVGVVIAVTLINAALRTMTRQPLTRRKEM